MDDFGTDFLQTEISRAVESLQAAQEALQKAHAASTVEDDEIKKAWTLAHANMQSAVWLCSSIAIAEAVGHLPSFTNEGAQVLLRFPSRQ